MAGFVQYSRNRQKGLRELSNAEQVVTSLVCCHYVVGLAF